MAQGDSISGRIVSSVDGEVIFIRPPIGEVWLITYFNANSSVYVNLTNGDILYEEDGYIEYDTQGISSLGGNENIKLFIDHNYFLLIEFTYEGRQFWWTGIQFK